MKLSETVWIRLISGDWCKFEIPVPLGQELRIISILKKERFVGDLITEIMSEVLALPPPIIDEECSSDQVLYIFNLLFPQFKSEDPSQIVQDVQLKIEGNADDIGNPISQMIAFLSYYAHMQPSEVLRLPRAVVEEIFREILGLLEKDQNLQFQLSAVNALSMIFGGGSQQTGPSDSSSPSYRPEPGSIDLSNLNDDTLGKLKGFDFVKVI